MTNGVEVINSRQSLTTFEDSRGRGDNIDVTLMTADCARRTQGWKVTDEELSDHRRISWTMTEEGNGRVAPEDLGSVRRLNLRGADWARIIQDARREFAALDGLMETITTEEGAGLLQEAIWEIYAKNVAKAAQGKKNNRWWTPRISEMRGDMRRKRKRWLRTRTEIDRGLFVRARNEYKSEIWKEKRKAWEELVLRDDRGDPWGKVYKILSANKSTTVLTSMKTGDGQYTTTIEETVSLFLRKLLPDDELDTDDEWHKTVRGEMGLPSTGLDCEDFTMEEIKTELKTMKKGKAPGKDGITVEMLRSIAEETGEVLKKLVNKMLRTGIFPTIWKIGDVKVFIKNEDKPKDEIKSYRPITLLPVCGKLAEKLINRRLMTFLDAHECLDPNQFGFRKDRSTVGALAKMVQDVLDVPDKYAIGIFADISGAFDNAWWPAIMRQLRLWECPGNLLELLRSYFSERSAFITLSGLTQDKKVTKGCPQGSVLGPTLWNVLFDELVRLQFGSEVKVTAYADDLLVIVTGCSREVVERRAIDALERMWNWGDKVKLEFSPTKTVGLVLKGKFDRNRPPILKVREQRIAIVDKVKYLGVHITERLGFEEQVKKVHEKTITAFGKLCKISRANSGYGCSTLKKLYKGLAEPMMLCGCEIWGQDIAMHPGASKSKKRLSLQRKLLIKVTKSYRTISHEAVRVIAGVEPIDLTIQEKCKVWNDVQNGVSKNESLAVRRQQKAAQWQLRWADTTLGRETFRYCPNVLTRMGEKWHTDYYVSMALSGHGNFKDKLFHFGLCDEGACSECQRPETAEHVIYKCSRYDAERLDLKNLIEERGLQLRQEDMMMDNQVREVFFQTVKTIMKSKEESERPEARE